MENHLRQYLLFTSELLQTILNVQTDNCSSYVYSFKRIKESNNTNNNKQSVVELKNIEYLVSLSKPTKQTPIPPISHEFIVVFELPSVQVLRKLDEGLPFIQHIQFLLENKKEPFELKLKVSEKYVEENLIKQAFQLISMIEHYSFKV
ncbi:hypothetical protein ABK040_003935 [Willaertia magna]